MHFLLLNKVGIGKYKQNKQKQLIPDGQGCIQNGHELYVI